MPIAATTVSSEPKTGAARQRTPGLNSSSSRLNPHFRVTPTSRVSSASVVSVSGVQRVGPFQPVVRNVQLDRITSSGSPRVLYIRGFPGAIIDDIRIARSTFYNVTETEVVQHAGTIILEQVTLNSARATRSLNSVPAKK